MPTPNHIAMGTTNVFLSDFEAPPGLSESWIIFRTIYLYARSLLLHLLLPRLVSSVLQPRSFFLLPFKLLRLPSPPLLLLFPLPLLLLLLLLLLPLPLLLLPLFLPLILLLLPPLLLPLSPFLLLLLSPLLLLIFPLPLLLIPPPLLLSSSPPLFLSSSRLSGEVRAVEGSPFDLRKPDLIGSLLKPLPGPGFDHNFCLASPGDPWALRPAAR